MRNDLPQIERVAQVIDSLAAGGAERMALNIANGLAQRGLESHLIATRTFGLMEDELLPNVKKHCLNRQLTIDVGAIIQLRNYILREKIQVLHAHSSSLFITVMAMTGHNSIRIIWHDHFGRIDTEKRNAFIYRTFLKHSWAAIGVSALHVAWINKLNALPSNRIYYRANYINDPIVNGDNHSLQIQDLFRIVCVANVRPEKDIITLIRAIAIIVKIYTNIEVLVVGSLSNQEYVQSVESEIQQYGLTNIVKMVGYVKNVNTILRECTLAVHPSRSEGLPLAILEYGRACLPVVATRVGQIAEVLDDGRCGILVPIESPYLLAEGIRKYLENENLRKSDSIRLCQRVSEQYSAKSALDSLQNIYEY